MENENKKISWWGKSPFIIPRKKPEGQEYNLTMITETENIQKLPRNKIGLSSSAPFISPKVKKINFNEGFEGKEVNFLFDEIDEWKHEDEYYKKMMDDWVEISPGFHKHKTLNAYMWQTPTIENKIQE